MKTKKIIPVVLLISLLGAAISCSGGGGSDGETSSDQSESDPESDDSSTSTDSKVECLKGKLTHLPIDQKKVIEISANAVIQCKASKSDVLAFIKMRRR